jgi:hypothetical protein
MGLVAAFIGVSIIIAIGAQILGNSVSDCTDFPDYSLNVVSTVTVGTAGNYTTAPTASFTGGSGEGATATVQTAATGGGKLTVSGVTVTDGGTGYLTAPTVVFTGGTPNPVAVATAILATDSTQEGWAGQCEDVNTQTQTAFALLIIVLIVIAAVIILSVVKML